VHAVDLPLMSEETAGVREASRRCAFGLSTLIRPLVLVHALIPLTHSTKYGRIRLGLAIRMIRSYGAQSEAGICFTVQSRSQDLGFGMSKTPLTVQARPRCLRPEDSWSPMDQHLMCEPIPMEGLR
jgi:hypothetical protein